MKNSTIDREKVAQLKRCCEELAHAFGEMEQADVVTEDDLETALEAVIELRRNVSAIRVETALKGIRRRLTPVPPAP